MAYPPGNIAADAADSTQANGYLAAKLNTLATAVDTVVTALGSAPAGSYADVTTRLGALSAFATGLLFVRPEDYGAHRDGATNDASAIGAAMAVAAAKGAALLLSPGVYRFDPTTTINVPPNVQVLGAGAELHGNWTTASWFILNSGSTIRGVTFTASSGYSGSVPLITVATGAVRPLIEGCAINSLAVDNGGQAVGAVNPGMVGLAVRRCSFSGYGTDVYASNTTTPAIGVEVSDCQLTGTVQVVGISSVPARNVRLLRNTWTYAPTTAPGISLRYVTNGRVDDNSWNLTTASSTASWITLYGTAGMRLRNNDATVTGPTTVSAMIYTALYAADLRLENNALNLGDASHGFSSLLLEDFFTVDRWATGSLRVVDNQIVGCSAPMLVLNATGLRTVITGNVGNGGTYLFTVTAPRDLVVKANQITGLTSGGLDFEETGSPVSVVHDIGDNHLTGPAGVSLLAADIVEGSGAEAVRGENTIVRKQSHGQFTSDTSGAWAAYMFGAGRGFSGILRVIAVRADGIGRASYAFRVDGQSGTILTAVPIPGAGNGARGSATMTIGATPVSMNGSNGLRFIGNVGTATAGVVVDWSATFDGIISISSGSTTSTSTSLSDGTVTGSRGSIGALANLLTVLAARGVVQDATTS